MSSITATYRGNQNGIHLKRSKVKFAGFELTLLWLRSRVYLIVLAAFVTGCNGPLFILKDSEPPSLYIDSRAKSFGMYRSIVNGDRFKHVVYFKEPLTKAATPSRLSAIARSNRLHVYIEGDGEAWRSRFVISDDPTSKKVLMLDLMAMDSARSLYVGRPCYLGRSDDPDCNSSLWTYHRFSDAVVDSMVDAITASVAKLNAAGKNKVNSGAQSEIVLFGHSGGAALAVLIAARLPQVTTVVTVAGNLDTRAWVKHHRYTPLFGSLNPAKQPPLSADIRQLHLLGARDTVIPPKLVKSWIDSQPGASVWQFDTYTHNCCWKQQWFRVLNWVETGVSPVLSGTL